MPPSPQLLCSFYKPDLSKHITTGCAKSHGFYLMLYSTKVVRSCPGWLLQESGRGLKRPYRCPRVAKATETSCKTGEPEHTFLSPVDHYRKMYFEVLDLLDGELEQRFEQRDLQVAVSLKHLIVSAEKERVDFLSSIVELYKRVFDFDSVLT